MDKDGNFNDISVIGQVRTQVTTLNFSVWFGALFEFQLLSVLGLGVHLILPMRWTMGLMLLWLRGYFIETRLEYQK